VTEEALYLPKLGMQMQEATVLRWLKAPGERVDSGEPVCLISTDKVEAEVESEFAGTLVRIDVPEGTTALVGTQLAAIEIDA
jgi:pyruvate/2-oxoglutarate dehydrogenase complex dihydrolipoamide acyltransferase (E2) component